MERYDSYKDSGFEWMGLIPSNWKLTKNRYGFQKYKNGKNESDETSVLSLTIKGVKVKTNLSFGKSTESYIGHQLVEEGDIVFTPRDFDQTPILSDVSRYNGCISNLYIVDKTKDGVLNHFVNYYWYGLKYSVDYFKNFSHGIRYSFNRFQFDEIPLLLPPLSEQQQIVTFLDTKISLIDSLIEKTQRKVELLKEKRTSLINEVVTKGLNPNVEMKDSGVEWIGEIPSSWEMKKIKFIFQEKKSTKNLELNSGSISFGVVVYKDDEKILESTKESYQELLKGEFLINPLNLNYDLKSLRIGMSRIDVVVSQGYIILILKEGFNPFYFEYLLRRFDVIHMKSLGQGVRQTISFNHIKDEYLVVPSIREQQQIVEYLDEQTGLIDKTISIEEKRIELLKEYRQSLISEVVTGKRKVVE